ncbi:MAG: TonB-dependent receptor, partial [Bacteroidales bacterium]|nr:TonB-dependent receptor [Bacteroidales bacterium]
MIQRYEKTGFNREISVSLSPFMKKCVFFAAAFLFAALSAGTAGAQSRVETIDKVTVSATRVPVALHSSARIVTLMDSLTIASAPAETVNDLLKYALGVDVRQRGAMGMQTDISIRGGTYNQVAVLLDGINITDPQTGHNSFDFPVNLCDIERIEVLEG